MPRILPLGLSLAFLCWSAAAHAHDPFQGWASATLKPEAIDLEITLALSTARQTLGDAAGKTPLTPDNFEEFQPKLQERAKTLYAVEANGNKLDPVSARVAITDEFDVQYQILYPPASAAPLAFRASYLEGWESTYGTTFAILDAKRKQLAYQDLTVDQPAIELAQLPSAAAKGAAANAIPSSAPQSVALVAKQVSGATAIPAVAASRPVAAKETAPRETPGGTGIYIAAGTILAASILGYALLRLKK